MRTDMLCPYFQPRQPSQPSLLNWQGGPIADFLGRCREKTKTKKKQREAILDVGCWFASAPAPADKFPERASSPPSPSLSYTRFPIALVPKQGHHRANCLLFLLVKFCLLLYLTRRLSWTLVCATRKFVRARAFPVSETKLIASPSVPSIRHVQSDFSL